MLETLNLTKEYRTKKGYVTKALKGISVTFPERGLVFLLGKSGSGKSTLLNILGGIDKATSGEVIIKGRSSSGFSESDYDSYRNTYVGFIFQEYNLIPEYSVGGNIGLALELHGKKADKTAVDEILRKVGLVGADGKTFFDRRTNELSGGQKQRVAIARALIKSPQIILADEPTGALDSKTGVELYNLLKNLSNDKLIIVVTHDRENAEKYGDRVIELADGKIVADTENPKPNKDPNLSGTREQCRFVKSRLPFTRTFTMGASGLTHKKFRLVLSVFLSVIAFSIFGFALTAGTVDEFSAEINTMYDNGLHMVSLSATQTDEDKNVSYTSFTAAQLRDINEYCGKAPITVFSSSAYNIEIDRISDQISDKTDAEGFTNVYYNLALGGFPYLAELNPETGAVDANLRPDERFENKDICRLPIDDSEIAITDIRANMFMRFGYKGEDGVSVNIKTPDDLIGKKLGEFTVCGVYSTEQDRNYFAKYEDERYLTFESDFFYKLCNGSRYSILSYGFVRDGFLSRRTGGNEINKVLLKLSGDYIKDKALLDGLTYSANGNTFSVALQSAVSEFISFVDLFKESLLLPFIIIAVIFSVFSALLMMNFLTVSIDFRKKELGILRALGARKKDVMQICLIESFIIALIDFAVTLIVVSIICLVLNKLLFIALFIVGFIPIISMFLLCFGVAALATVLPVIRITNKKPIDIINGK